LIRSAPAPAQHADEHPADKRSDREATREQRTGTGVGDDDPTIIEKLTEVDAAGGGSP
jgi:hypothetical protein